MTVQALRRPVTVFIIFSIISIGAYSLYSVFQKEEKHASPEGAKLLGLIEGLAPLVQKRFELGDRENLYPKGEFVCKDIPFSNQIGQDYLECNPHYLDCFFQQKKINTKFQISYEGLEYVFIPKLVDGSYLKTVSRRSLNREDLPFKSYLVNFTLKGSDDIVVNLLLQDTCRDVYLPQRVFLYQEHSLENTKEIKWNNRGRNLFIDKRLVTFRDILDWQEVGGGQSVQVPMNKVFWSFPADNLTPEEMEDYCEFEGKQVIQAHILDAASFYPIDLENTSYLDRSFPPYAWTSKKYVEEYYQVAKKKKEFHYELCEKIYSKECLENNILLKLGEEGQRSWVGLKQVMGGFPEYVKNPFHPVLNVRASSFYFESTSLAHQVGQRMSWDEKRFEKSSVRYLGKKIGDPKESFKIGFRCMKEQR